VPDNQTTSKRTRIDHDSKPLEMALPHEKLKHPQLYETALEQALIDSGVDGTEIHLPAEEELSSHKVTTSIVAQANIPASLVTEGTPRIAALFEGRLPKKELN
jgi:hypothetical protein